MQAMNIRLGGNGSSAAGNVIKSLNVSRNLNLLLYPSRQRKIFRPSAITLLRMILEQRYLADLLLLNIVKKLCCRLIYIVIVVIRVSFVKHFILEGQSCMEHFNAH